MNIADLIKSIECEAFREVQAHEIAGRNGEHIDCSTLGDKPVIVADNEADRQALRDCFKGVSVWSAKTKLRKLKKK